MLFKCKTCGKEFPLVAWIEMATTTYPNLTGWQGTNPTQWASTSWQSTTTIKKPCCPYCSQLDLDEVPADKKAPV